MKDGECQAEFHDNLVYLTLTACVEFFVPLVSICSLNLAVYLNIRKRSRGLIRTENPMFTIKEAGTHTSEKTSTVKSSSFQKTNTTTTSTTTTPPPAASVTTPPSAKTKQEAALPSSPPMDQIKVLDEAYKNKRKSIITSASETSGSSDELSTIAAAKRIKTKTKSSIRIKFKLNSRLSIKGQEAPSIKAAITENLNLVKAPLLTDNNGQFKPITTTKTNTAINNNNNVAKKNSLPVNVLPRKSLPHIKKPTTARTTLSKDKKAARSLFILVFVFVFCWVRNRTDFTFC